MGKANSKSNSQEAIFNYPKHISNLINDQQYLGRMNDPTSSAFIKGPCGDEMECYLIIKENKISEVKFYTEGCEATKACGAMTAKLAKGKTISEALLISPGEVIAKLQDLPRDHLHCSILSISTLYRAVADYLLKK